MNKEKYILGVWVSGQLRDLKLYFSKEDAVKDGKKTKENSKEGIITFNVFPVKERMKSNGPLKHYV